MMVIHYWHHLELLTQDTRNLSLRFVFLLLLLLQLDSGLLQICWVESPQEERQQRTHRLLSLGTDGLLLLWKWPKQSDQLMVVTGYRLTTESVPRGLRTGRAGGDTVMGGLSVTISDD